MITIDITTPQSEALRPFKFEGILLRKRTLRGTREALTTVLYTMSDPSQAPQNEAAHRVVDKLIEALRWRGQLPEEGDEFLLVNYRGRTLGTASIRKANHFGREVFEWKLARLWSRTSQGVAPTRRAAAARIELEARTLMGRSIFEVAPRPEEGSNQTQQGTP